MHIKIGARELKIYIFDHYYYLSFPRLTNISFYSHYKGLLFSPVRKARISSPAAAVEWI